MQNRTWTLTLKATDDQPERTLEGIAHTDVAHLINDLIHGSLDVEQAEQYAAGAQERVPAAA